jgi:hypothetical protein
MQQGRSWDNLNESA